MSCPHPRGATERVIGTFTELVCPDCHARLAPAAEEPVEAVSIIEGLIDEIPVGDDPYLVCGEIDGEFACGLAPEHEGDHDFSLDAGDEETPETDEPRGGAIDPAGPGDDQNGSADQDQVSSAEDGSAG